jgi:hypothetical protein
MEFLSEYDFEIKHIKDNENQVVDALNIKSIEMHVSSIIMYETYLKEKILEVENSYQHYPQMKKKLQQGNLQ